MLRYILCSHTLILILTEVMVGMCSEIEGERQVKLTKREVEVLGLALEGKTTKDIADALYVSKRTIDFHLANIYDKLQVSGRVQAFRRASRLGLVPAEA